MALLLMPVEKAPQHLQVAPIGAQDLVTDQTAPPLRKALPGSLAHLLSPVPHSSPGYLHEVFRSLVKETQAVVKTLYGNSGRHYLSIVYAVRVQSVDHRLMGSMLRIS